jgi:hypothetical protein
MTLAELSTAWNDLRNAALGQGLVPNVKPVTATKIGNYYERWRAWYATAGAMSDLVPDATAAQWLSLYRDAAKLALADGAKFTVLEQQPLERLATSASQLQSAVWSSAVKGLLFLAPVLLLMVAVQRRR